MLDKKPLVANAEKVKDLIHYVEHSNDAMFKSILDQVPDILISTYGSNDHLVIHTLLERKKLTEKMVKSLINLLRKKVTDKLFCQILRETLFVQINSKTTTLGLCIKGNYPELVKQLILMGVDPNRREPSGELPLHEALLLKKNNDALVKVLLAQGASVFMRSNFIRKNAKEMSNSSEISRYMDIGMTFISHIENDDVTELQALAIKYPFLITMPFENEKTALHLAAQNGAIRVLEFLLKQDKTTLSALDNCGHPALHYGLKEENSIITKALLSAGAQYGDENLLDISKDNILELIYSGNYKNSQNKSFQKPKALDPKNKAIISMASLLLMIFGPSKLAPKPKDLLSAFPEFAKQTPRTLVDFFRIAHYDFLEESTQACLYQVLTHPSIQNKIANCEDNPELQAVIKQINTFTTKKRTRWLSGKELLLAAVAEKNPILFEEKLNEFEDILLLWDQNNGNVLLELLNKHISNEIIDILIIFLTKKISKTKEFHTEFSDHTYLFKYLAAAIPKNYPKLMQFLLEFCPDLQAAQQIKLLQKAGESYEKSCEVLLSHGVTSFNAVWRHQFSTNRTKIKEYRKIGQDFVGAIEHDDLASFKKMIQKYPIFLRAIFTELQENIYHLAMKSQSLSILLYLLSANPRAKEIQARDTNGRSPWYYALQGPSLKHSSLLFPHIDLDQAQADLKLAETHLIPAPDCILFPFKLVRLLLAVLQIPQPKFATLCQDFPEFSQGLVSKTLEALVKSAIGFCLTKSSIEHIVLVLEHYTLKERIAAYADHPKLADVYKVIHYEIKQLTNLANSTKMLCSSVEEENKDTFKDLLTTFPESLYIQSQYFSKGNLLLQLLKNKQLYPAIKTPVLDLLEKMKTNRHYCSRLLSVTAKKKSVLDFAVELNSPEILKQLLLMTGSTTHLNFDVKQALIFALQNNYDEIFEILIRYADTSFEINSKENLQFIVSEYCSDDKKNKINGLITTLLFYKKTLITNMATCETTTVQKMVTSYPSLLRMPITGTNDKLFSLAQRYCKINLMSDLLLSNSNVQMINFRQLDHELVIFAALLTSLFQQPSIELETLLLNFPRLVKKQKPETLNHFFQLALRKTLESCNLDEVNTLLNHPKLIEKMKACNQNCALRPIIDTITHEIPNLMAAITELNYVIETQDSEKFKRLIESPLLFTMRAYANKEDRSKNYHGKRLLALFRQTPTPKLLRAIIEFLNTKAQNTEFCSQFKELHEEDLTFAVRYNRPELVELLVTNGINPTSDALELAAEKGYQHIFEFLLLNGANTFNIERNASRKTTTIREILDATDYANKSQDHAKIKSIFESYDKALQDFITSIEDSDIEHAKKIVAKYPIFLQIFLDDKQRTALHIAVCQYYYDQKRLDFLLQQEEIKKSVNKLAYIPYHMFSDFNYQSNYGTTFTVLHYAVRHKKLELLRSLLTVGADPDFPTEEGITPLAFAAELDDQNLATAFICELMHKGANPEKAIEAFKKSSHRSVIYTTLLILAVLKARSHYELPFYLYEEFPTLGSFNNINEVFDFAITDFLVKSKLSWDELFEHSLLNNLLACEEFHPLKDTIAEIVNKASLSHAIKRNDLRAITDLIKDKRLVEKYLDGDKNAIHLAVSLGKYQSLKLILNNYPFLINQIDLSGQTPFDYALQLLQKNCSEDLLKVLHLLFKRGATIKLSSKEFEKFVTCISTIPNKSEYLKILNKMKCWLDLERHARKLQEQCKDSQNILDNLHDITLHVHQPAQRLKILASMLEKATNSQTGFFSHFMSSEATLIRKVINSSHSAVWKFAFDKSGTLMFTFNHPTENDKKLLQAILENNLTNKFKLNEIKSASSPTILKSHQVTIMVNQEIWPHPTVDEISKLVKSLVNQGLIENKTYQPSQLPTFHSNVVDKKGFEIQ